MRRKRKMRRWLGYAGNAANTNAAIFGEKSQKRYSISSSSYSSSASGVTVAAVSIASVAVVAIVYTVQYCRRSRSLIFSDEAGVKKVNEEDVAEKDGETNHRDRSGELWTFAGDNGELTAVDTSVPPSIADENSFTIPTMLTTLTKCKVLNNRSNGWSGSNHAHNKEEFRSSAGCNGTMNQQWQNKKKPTVVIIHGFGCNSMEFANVAKEIARQVKLNVFSYDRVVFAGSGRNNQLLHYPRTAETLAKELRVLLTNRGVPPPYLLVGHSYGGLIAQCFTMMYHKQKHNPSPKEERVKVEDTEKGKGVGSGAAVAEADLVAGLVLIDPAHEKQFEHFPLDFTWSMKCSPIIMKLYSLLAATGMLRFMDRLSFIVFPPLFLYDESRREAARELYSKPSSWKMVLAEWEGVLKTFEEMSTFRKRYPPLTQGIPCSLVFAANRNHSPTLYPNKVTDSFLFMHRDLTERIGAEIVLADDSDHWVQLQSPHLVVNAVMDVYTRVIMQGLLEEDEGSSKETSVVIFG